MRETMVNRLSEPYSTKAVSKYIEQICFDVEKRITGHSVVDSNIWAKANSVRHAHTIIEIVNYAKKNNNNRLKILNASGLSCGHQDFSIATFLREQTDINFEWIAFESPYSEYLNNSVFKNYISELKLKLILSDFKESSEPYHEDNNIYDVILFTEIAEHLDHSVLLRSLLAIKKKIKDYGILIITTPHLVSLVIRIRILFGDGDRPYYGDGKRNYEKGLYGHIVNYDLKRMQRLLQDIGFKLKKAQTFTYGNGPIENKYRLIMTKLIKVLSLLGKKLGTTLFIVAEKSDDMKRIPFQI
jgi:hypothetical protein